MARIGRAGEGASALTLLVLLCVVSAGARTAWIGAPCRAPCRTPADHLLVFDEVYYVNAARGSPACGAAATDYAGEPAGGPQLRASAARQARDRRVDRAASATGRSRGASGSISSDRWRSSGCSRSSRRAGEPASRSVLAATLHGADNLLLVHGRIATLDIYAVASMIWAAALYLRDGPSRRRRARGRGGVKLVVPYVVVVLALFELIRQRRAALRAAAPVLVGLTALATGVYLAVLGVFDRIAPPYDPQTARRHRRPVRPYRPHVSYAAGADEPARPQGHRLLPVGLAGRLQPIDYLEVNPKS